MTSSRPIILSCPSVTVSPTYYTAWDPSDGSTGQTNTSSRPGITISMDTPAKSTKNRSTAPDDTMPPAKEAVKPEVQPKDMSDYKYLKSKFGDGNMKHFMDRWGLCIHEEEEYAEAKNILKSFKELDQQIWEDEHAKK